MSLEVLRWGGSVSQTSAPAGVLCALRTLGSVRRLKPFFRLGKTTEWLSSVRVMGVGWDRVPWGAESLGGKRRQESIKGQAPKLWCSRGRNPCSCCWCSHTGTPTLGQECAGAIFVEDPSWRVLSPNLLRSLPSGRASLARGLVGFFRAYIPS